MVPKKYNSNLDKASDLVAERTRVPFGSSWYLHASSGGRHWSVLWFGERIPAGITIASACNRYWRKHHLVDKTIAVEPRMVGMEHASISLGWHCNRWLTSKHCILKPSIMFAMAANKKSSQQKVTSLWMDGVRMKRSPLVSTQVPTPCTNFWTACCTQRLEFRQSVWSCSGTRLFHSSTCLQKHRTNGRCEANLHCVLCQVRNQEGSHLLARQVRQLQRGGRSEGTPLLHPTRKRCPPEQPRALSREEKPLTHAVQKGKVVKRGLKKGLEDSVKQWFDF